MRRTSRYWRSVALAARVLVATPVAFAGNAYALKGDVTLPAPYVSRALDAVLMPINNAVRKAFKLKKKDQGVLVISVEPKGVAARRGIMPGDVLSTIKGRKIRKPIDVDIISYYWIEQGIVDFLIDLFRGDEEIVYECGISRDDYFSAIDVAGIASWTAWSVSTSFSYSEFYSEYSESISTSYQSSETTIEQVATSQEFKDEIANDAKDTDGDGQPDGVDPDNDNDGVPDEADQDADGDGQADAPDSDNDGIADGNDNDGDNDGVPDTADTDDDGDGTADTAEADVDGDGTPDDLDADDDNDGTEDFADADDDNDGVADADEGDGDDFAGDDGGDDIVDDGGDDVVDDGGDDVVDDGGDDVVDDGGDDVVDDGGGDDIVDDGGDDGGGGDDE